MTYFFIKSYCQIFVKQLSDKCGQKFPLFQPEGRRRGQATLLPKTDLMIFSQNHPSIFRCGLGVAFL